MGLPRTVWLFGKPDNGEVEYDSLMSKAEPNQSNMMRKTWRKPFHFSRTFLGGFLMLHTRENADWWTRRRDLNMFAYTVFASDYECEIVEDVLRVLRNYDGTVPPNVNVEFAMRAYFFTNPRVDDLILVLGDDISDELRVFIYDLFDMNPSDDELTKAVVDYLHDPDDYESVNQACEYFIGDELGYVPTKHQARIIEDVARKKLGPR